MLESSPGLVMIPLPDGGTHGVDARAHRPDVVRRLLSHGVSAATLRAVLPEWRELIDDVDREVAGVCGVAAVASVGSHRRHAG